MKKIRIITMLATLAVFGASIWVEFYRPFRDLGVARSGIPELACLTAFATALIATTCPFYRREKRIRDSIVPALGVSLLFGATAWVMEAVFYFNYWKYGVGPFFVAASLVGGIVFLIPLVTFKLIKKWTDPGAGINSVTSLRDSTP